MRTLKTWQVNALSDVEYLATQQKMQTLANLLLASKLDLNAFLERIALAESIAPITDPTLYKKGAGKLDDVKRLANSLKPFLKEAKRQAGAKW